jgi:hypothetical protein
MKRTGLKILANKRKQLIQIALFDEQDPETSLKIELEPDMTLAVAERLLSASAELNQKPTRQKIKQFLTSALGLLDKSPNRSA